MQMDLIFGTVKGLTYSPVRSEAVQEAVQAADADAGVVEPEHVAVDSSDAPRRPRTRSSCSKAMLCSGM
eukprot:4911720-Pyramimonas_sp.AAC.1